MGPGVDPNTGLVYMRARWYDPQTGQFLSVDPLDTETGAAYYYAEDDPTTFSDPTGLDSWCVVLIPGGLAGPGCAPPPSIPNPLPGVAHAIGQLASGAWQDVKSIGNAIGSLLFSSASGPNPEDEDQCAPEGANGPEGPVDNADATEDTAGSLWDDWQGTNMSDEDSFNYHFATHGDGRTAAQYSQDASNWAENPAGSGTEVKLANGETGIRYRTPGGGPGGILTQGGKIVTFWYH
jgi:RHS repeat-associated protein